mmetsp:Transcript_16174/g.28009  ORF Transcript_16174/g.28009 Transcript_16174/m.28009 type:complete len:107 (+) Transcript_16174:1-321(+)
MRETWLRADHVRCTHPMSPARVEGFEAVMVSWEEILAQLAALPTAQRSPVWATHQSWVVYDDSALVTQREDFARNRVEATNVFERVDEFQWRLIHYHGTHARLGVG